MIFKSLLFLGIIFCILTSCKKAEILIEEISVKEDKVALLYIPSRSDYEYRSGSELIRLTSQEIQDRICQDRFVVSWCH